jgi:hypothetical protein
VLHRVLVGMRAIAGERRLVRGKLDNHVVVPRLAKNVFVRAATDKELAAVQAEGRSIAPFVLIVGCQ